MNRFLTRTSCLLLVAGLASPALADRLVAPVDFAEPVREMRPEGVIWRVPDTTLEATPGAPLLPRATVTFVLPHGHLPAGVRLEAVRTEQIEGTHRIAPARMPVPFSRPDLLRPARPDPRVYGLDAAVPGVWVAAGAVQHKHGYALLPVAVYPLSYRPLSGRLERLITARVVVTTRPGGTAARVFRADPEDARAVARRAQVIDAIDTYPQTARLGPARLDPGDYPYLVVSPEQFTGIESPFGLEALVQARTDAGLAGTIVTLEWIQANYEGLRPDGGQDDATRIRDFLTDAYGEWGTRYVLLVGDADAGDNGGESGNDILQVRKLFVAINNPEVEDDHLPADMYYSCLDGSFDHDADGIYGELNDGPGGDEVDLMSELLVGRLPADSTDEVTRFVAKTLAYEQGAGTWLQQVWMVGELLFEDPEVWGGDFMDELITGIDSPSSPIYGFDSFPFFQTETLYDRDNLGGSWPASALIDALNNGPHIVNHLGHSNPTYNMRLSNPDVDGLYNPHPFLQYTQGCLAGAFDNSYGADYDNYVDREDCIAEHLVVGEHGAFATIANSRYGWGGSYLDTPSQIFHRQFWDAFFQEGAATIGEAFVDAKEDNAFAFLNPYNRWVGFEVNLLGDPAVALKKSLNTTDPLIGVYPAFADFFTRPGDPAPPAEVLRVVNDGVDSLTYSASVDQPWITVVQASAEVPSDLEIGVDATGLAPGRYEATVTIESPEAGNSPFEVPVVFYVIEVPEVRVPHTQQAPVLDGIIAAGEYDGGLAIPADPDGIGDSMIYLQIAGSKLYIAAVDGRDGTENPGDYFRMLFDKALDEQWPSSSGGDDAAYWVFMGRNGPEIYYIPVFDQGEGPMYDWNSGWENPPGVDGTGGYEDGSRIYEMAIDLEESHLDVTIEGAFGMYISAMDYTEQVGETTLRWPTMVPSLEDQRYFGKIDLCPEGPRLDAAPLALAFEAVEGDDPPGLATVEVFDRNDGAISYIASPGAEWLQVAPGAGTTPSQIGVAVDHAGLASGTYQADVILDAPEAWNSPLALPVTLEVLPPPAWLEVAPASIEVTAAADAPDPQAILLVQNTGGRPMPYDLAATDAWVQPDPASGILAPGASREVTITLALDGLGSGVHQSTLAVTGQDAEHSPVDVPVRLEVVAARPVPPVEELAIEPGDGVLGLSWTLPDDALVAGVRIRRAAGDPPAGPALGDAVYDGTDEELTDTGLANGTRYCYGAFAYDASGRFAEPATACGTPGDNHPPPVPSLLSPLDGAVLGAVPALVAGTVTDPESDAVAYGFQLLDGTANAVLDEGSGTVEGDRVTFLPTMQLEQGKTYRWRVEATDARGAASGFSAPWSFTLRAPTADGGTDGGPDDGDAGGGGCGCAGTPAGPASGIVWLLLAGLLLLRRLRPFG